MSSSKDYVEYVCSQLEGAGFIAYRKMFGEYMVYVNAKPLFLVCDNTVYVKKLECLEYLLKSAGTGNPYTGAKEHYILDIDNAPLSREVAAVLEPITPLPKPKRKKLP